MIAVLVDGEHLKIFLIIGGRFEDLLSLVAAGNDMVEGAFEFYPRLPWHSRTMVGSDLKIELCRSIPKKFGHYDLVGLHLCSLD